MRFMLLIKATKDSEAGRMPGEKLLVAMGKYNEELVKAGVLVSGEGLQESAKGFRVKNRGGTVTTTDGPFPETKELVAGFWILQVKSKEEAIEWAKRVPFEAGVTGTRDGGAAEIEVRQLMDLSDLPADVGEAGGCADQHPPPPQAERASGGARKLRYILMAKADAKTEAGVPATREQFAAMSALMGRLAAEGKILGGEGLKPSAKGARVRFVDGKRTVIDGPFTESKELICGFAILQVDSEEEARAIAKEGCLMNGDSDSEARRVFMEEDFSPELHAAVPEVFEKEREMRATLGT